MGRNDNNTLGIPRANLELKHWSYVHNLFQFGAMINHKVGVETLITKRMFFVFSEHHDLPSTPC